MIDTSTGDQICCEKERSQHQTGARQAACVDQVCCEKER